MKISVVKSKKILQLEEQIQQGYNKALEEFWKEIETHGTPIIEEIEGDTANNIVTFLYKADEELENVVLFSSIRGLDVEDSKMKRLMKTDLWHISLKLRNDLRFGYYFSPNDSSDDDWKQKSEKMASDKYNKNITVFKISNGKKDFSRPYVVMPNADEHFWVKKREAVSKGNLEEYQFESKNMEDSRRIRIYTPHEYSEENKPYRFLVLTDGDQYINLLSATHVLDNLIADEKIPPIVTIFIDSTENRSEELRCNDIFSNIVADELIPWVRDKYNISDNPEEAIIGGYSLGGLTASYLGLRHSKVFGNVLSQSGSYWYTPDEEENNEKNCWMSTQFKSIDKLPLKFYMNIGVIETQKTMINTNINLRDVLLSKGYTVDYEEFKSGHDFLGWGETLANGLISLIGK